MAENPTAQKQETKDKLTARERFSYGFGDFASCLYWQSISQYLTLFYTDVFGLQAKDAGAMIGLSRSADAFVDPAVGMAADRTKTRMGKFRPYLLFGCVPLAVAGVLTFTVPSLGYHGKLVWAAITFNVMMILYTLINIPYTAMLGVISPDPNERTGLSSIKFVGAFSAGIVVSATLLPMAKVGGWLGASTVERGWQLSFVIYGLAAIASFLVVYFNTRERVQPPSAQKTSIGKDLVDLVTNGPWVILLATTITFILFVALRGNITAYYFKYYVGNQKVTLPTYLPAFLAGTHDWGWEALVSAFNTTNQILSLLGTMLVPFVARIGGRKVTFTIFFTIAIVSTGIFYVFKPENLVLIYLVGALGSITGGPLSVLLWAMYADTADYAEWKKGSRATGLVFSASIFSQKQGWAVGAYFSGLLMSSAGFVANQAQTPESLHGLVSLMSIYPAAIGLLSLLILLVFYPLSEKRMAQIAIDLKERRAQAAA
jgi:glycoside/pentoside/hexuronide:cation symporter, GPH family